MHLILRLFITFTKEIIIKRQPSICFDGCLFIVIFYGLMHQNPNECIIRINFYPQIKPSWHPVLWQPALPPPHYRLERFYGH